MATVECPSCRTSNPSEALYCSTCGSPTHQSDGDELIGVTVGGRYHLVEKIGQGSAGTLYRAEHVTLRRRMAVKLLHKQLALSDEAIERFRREAITVCEIDNDHIPQVHDFGRTDDDRLFFAMEFLDGETLSSVIERDGRLSPERASDILTQMADGLMEAHTLGYVHRDLRPRSIFLTRRRGRQDFVKILDFGLAKLVQPDIDAQRTTMGMTYGDPRYMAPEQARGEAVDRRGDIYSLGALGFEMLVGEPPFKGGGTFEVLQKVLDAPVPRVRDRRPDCPPWLESVVRTALAKRPGDRFQTVAQLLDALGRKQVLPNQPPMPMQLTNQQASKLASSRDAPSVPGRNNPIMQVFVSSPSLRPIPVAEEGVGSATPTQVMPTVVPGNRSAGQTAAAKPAPAAQPAAVPTAPRTTLSYPTVKPARSGTAPGMQDARSGEAGGGASDPKGSTSGEMKLLGSRLPPVEPKSVPPARAPEPVAKASLLVAATSPPRNDPTPRTARAMLEQEAMAWEEAALPVMTAADLTDSASMSEPTGRAPSADTPVEEMKFGAGAHSASSPPAAGGAAPRPISAPAIAAMRSLHPGPSGPKASEPVKAVPVPVATSASAPTRTLASAGTTKPTAASATSAPGGPRITGPINTSQTSDRIAAKKSAPSPSQPGEPAMDAAVPKTSDKRSDSAGVKVATAAKSSDSRPDSVLAKAADSSSKPGDSRSDAKKPALSPSRPGENRADVAARPAAATPGLHGRETVPFERVAPTPSAISASKSETDKPLSAVSARPLGATTAAAGGGLLAGDEEVEGADTGDATIPQIRMPGRDDETPIIGHGAGSSRSPVAAAAASGEITEPTPAAQPDAPSHDTPPDAVPRAGGAESNWFSTPAASAADSFAADDGDVAIGRRGLPKWAIPVAAAATVLLLAVVYVATRPSPQRPGPTAPTAGSTEPTTASNPPAPPAATPPSTEPTAPPANPPANPPAPAPTAEAVKPDSPAAKPGPEVTPLPVATAIPTPAPTGESPSAPKGPEPGATAEDRPAPGVLADKPAASPAESGTAEKATSAAKAPAKTEREPRPASAAAKSKAAAERPATAASGKGEGKSKAAPKPDEPSRKETEKAAAPPSSKGDAESGTAKAEKGEKKPGDATALVQNGRKKLDDGEPEAAAALFSRAIELDPRNAEAVGGLGESSFEQGNFEAAARHLAKAAKLAPKRSSYQELLVQALYKVGRFKDCVEACRKLLKQSPNSAKAKQTLELAEKKLGPAE